MYSLEDAVPVYRPDDNEHMGYIVEDDAGWAAVTIFGCQFAVKPSKAEAQAVVLDKGLAILTEPWEYWDPETKEWERCVIIEASQTTVRVAKFYGPYPDPTHDYLIKSPGERTLRYNRQ